VAVRSAEVELVQSIWPREADMVELVASMPALVDALPDAFDPHVEIRFHPDEPGEFGTLSGVEGFTAAWGEWLEPWESYRYVVEDYVDAGGGTVVVLAHVRARTRRDGVLVEHSPAVLCRVRDGRLAKLDFYLDGAEALAAAGRP
jgi:ketosteroid isomerase-like protein